MQVLSSLVSKVFEIHEVAPMPANFRRGLKWNVSESLESCWDLFHLRLHNLCYLQDQWQINWSPHNETVVNSIANMSIIFVTKDIDELNTSPHRQVRCN